MEEIAVTKIGEVNLIILELKLENVNLKKEVEALKIENQGKQVISCYGRETVKMHYAD